MTDETETTTAEEEPQDISGLFDDDTRTDEGAEAADTEGESEQTGEEATGDEGESEEGSQQAEEATQSEESQEPESTEDESEPPSDEEEGSVPRQALLDERRKRQEAQEQLDKLKREYGAQEEDDAPDPRDDPEGYEKHIREKVEKENWEKRANQSRERMLEQHSDYEDKERHFMMLAQQDQDLIRQMNEHPEPARFAYEKATESLTKQEKAVEDRVIERLRKEGRLKEETSGKKEEESKGSDAAESASKVADLTSSAGAGNNSSDQVQESNDPADVFGDLKY